MLLTRTTQPMYDAARDAKGPDAVFVESDEDVGHMTSKIGKSLVQEDTSRAVEIALGVAKPGLGVFWRSRSNGGCPACEVGEVGSEDVCREWLMAVSLAVAVACEDVLEWPTGVSIGWLDPGMCKR